MSCLSPRCSLCSHWTKGWWESLQGIQGSELVGGM